MSASALMSTGTQAIFASYRQIQTTANNIANANTEGYSRQSVQLQTAKGQLTGDGFIGRGVTVTTVSRAADTFKAAQTNALTAAAATDKARADALGQLQLVFGKTDSGLGYAATQVFSAYADLAAAPSDLAARQAVLGRLEDFASLSRSTSQGIADLQNQLQTDVKNSVSEVNGIAQSLAKLNVQIANEANSGHQPNDLLDQRDTLVNHLSELIEVHAITGVDGQASVFVASGEALVLGNTANQLVTVPDEVDPSHLNMGIQINGGLTLLSRANSSEGRIPGLLKVQNDDLVAARNDLGQVVTSMALMLNQQQARGLDLSGGIGTPLFTVSPSPVTSATTNAKDGSGHFISSMTVAITDPSQLQASDYVVQADPANVGTYLVTRQSDGEQHSGVLSGDVIDGFRLTEGANVPAPGERFLVKPVGGAANDLQVALRNPLGLAAANPVTASAPSSNKGTLSVAAVTVGSSPSLSYQALSVNFSADPADPSQLLYTVVDANNSTLQPASPYTAGAPIQIDNLSLSLSGVPQAGDLVSIKPTQHVASSNGNALTMQGFGEQKIVGGHQTATDAFAATLSDMGVRTQSAQASAGNTGRALQQAKTELTGETGVNLDEEAARLIQYQQGYQAAAKILQTAQSMLDTILQMSR